MPTHTHTRCPCHSGKTYASCCQPYHQGVLAENALALMRSRYSAYALGIASYIIKTTHPQSPHYVPDRRQWLQTIQTFSKQVVFKGLDILATEQQESEAFVSFIAQLNKEGVDLTFSERSRFLKQEQMWLYVDGKIAKGRLTAAQLKNL